MRKETETKNNMLFCHICIISDISIGGGCPPLAVPMVSTKFPTVFMKTLTSALC